MKNKVVTISLTCLLCVYSVLSIRAQNTLPYQRFRIDITPFTSLNFGKQFNGANPNFAVEPKFFITKNFSLGLKFAYNLTSYNFKNQEMTLRKDGSGVTDLIADVFVNALTAGAAANVNSMYDNKTVYLNGKNTSRYLNLSLTADWHILATHTIRPYIGLGIGVSSIKEHTYKMGNEYQDLIMSFEKDGDEKGRISPATNFTALVLNPRIGLDLWHMRIGVEYNLVSPFSELITTEAVKDRPIDNGGYTIVKDQSELHYENRNFSYFTISISAYLFGNKK